MQFKLKLILIITLVSCSQISEKENTLIPGLSKSLNMAAFKPIKNKKEIQQFFQFLHQEKGFNGNILIFNKGQLYRESFGWADIPNQTLLKQNAQFQIASMSKPFTALSIMQLIRKGKLKLSDTINQFFDSWPYSAITIDHLLSHTSGIPEYMNLADNYWKDSTGYLNNADITHLFQKTKPALYFTPGSAHDYCNSNFILLANIIEKVTGINYPQYFKENIAMPLGIDSTFVYQSTDSLMQQEVKGHYGLGHYLEDHYLNGSYGDKNIWSTTTDLFRFYRGLYNPKFLNTNERKTMFTTMVKKAKKGSQYARGWRKKVIEKDTWMYHTGWWKGFKSNLFFHTKKKYCFIVLSNKLKSASFPSEMIADFFTKNSFTKAYSYYFNSPLEHAHFFRNPERNTLSRQE